MKTREKQFLRSFGQIGFSLTRAPLQFNRHKRILAAVSITLIMQMTIGCYQSEVVMNEEFFTKHQLFSLKTVAIVVHYEVKDLRGIQLSEMLEFADKNNFLEHKANQREWYSIDSWKTPIRMTTTVDHDELIVRFISAGKNRVFENGQGDDLVTTVTFPIKKK
jgi:hypothetical protein